MKKYAYFLLIFMVALFAAIGSEFKESGTVAKYLSKIDGSDSARVAKWDISAVDKDGESVIMIAESRTVPSGSGSWYFQINNKSEVDAKIANTSKIKIRLDSEQLSEIYKISDHDWDFVTVNKIVEVDGVEEIQKVPINNPINFKLELYTGEITYKVKEAFTFNTVNYAVNQIIDVYTYNNILDKDASLASKLDVVYPNTTPSVVFDTSIDNNPNIVLVYHEEGTGTNKVKYLEAEISVSETDLDMNTTFTYKLTWDVQLEDDGTGLGGVSNKYYVYNSYTSSSVYERQTYDYFEYLIYLSSLNGEPSFTYRGKATRYSKLTQAQIDLIKNENETDIEHDYNIVDDLNICEYERFLSEKKEFEANLGYLEMGLKISIEFGLTVVQVD